MRRSAIVALLMGIEACERPPAAPPAPAITIPPTASNAPEKSAPAPAWHANVKAAPADALFEWHSVNTGVGVTLRDLAEGSGVFAVGDNGTILRSWFPYREWTPKPSNTTERLNGVTCTEHPDYCIVVGAHGTILRSSRAMGDDWTREESGTTNDLHAITTSRDDNHLFYAVGAKGTILRSDGSGRWTQMDSGTTDDLFTVSNVEAAAKPLNMMWAAGDHGTVLMLGFEKSGGVWKRVDAGVTQPIYGSVITLPNNTSDYHLVLVGAHGAMTHATTTRGTPWTPDDPHAPIALRAPLAVWVADQAIDPARWPLGKFERLLMVGGEGGTLLVRNEPGREWVRLTGLPTHDIFAVHEEGNTLLFAGANGSMLLALPMESVRDRWKRETSK